MVPTEGVEPTHPHGYQILSLARLPVPPRRHLDSQYISTRVEVNQFRRAEKALNPDLSGLRRLSIQS